MICDSYKSFVSHELFLWLIHEVREAWMDQVSTMIYNRPQWGILFVTQFGLLSHIVRDSWMNQARTIVYNRPQWGIQFVTHTQRYWLMWFVAHEWIRRGPSSTKQATVMHTVRDSYTTLLTHVVRDACMNQARTIVESWQNIQWDNDAITVSDKKIAFFDGLCGEKLV